MTTELGKDIQDIILDSIADGVETFRDMGQVEELRKRLEGKYTFADIIRRSPARQVRLLNGLHKRKPRRRCDWFALTLPIFA